MVELRSLTIERHQRHHCFLIDVRASSDVVVSVMSERRSRPPVVSGWSSSSEVSDTPALPAFWGTMVLAGTLSEGLQRGLPRWIDVLLGRGLLRRALRLCWRARP